MRTELKAKFIQHLNRKQSEKGFTLVELLVVIIIIGILAAIALPNFLSQGAKAKQTEAKQNIGLVNRVQTAYRSENSAFATTFDVLATGTMSGGASFTSTSYTYTLAAGQDTTTLIAGTADTALKTYSGGTVRFINESSASVIASVVCEALTPGSGTSTAPGLTETARVQTSAVACPATGYKAL
ncbi:type IV pilin-like G/H family protein [Chamaesiphon sp.]|uniref:type IV pilin-like G/H family protein n=1 Tax=Chamaesiphon sp. TaxID=2814140 RepID=UPI0035938B2D